MSAVHLVRCLSLSSLVACAHAASRPMSIRAEEGECVDGSTDSEVVLFPAESRVTVSEVTTAKLFEVTYGASTKVLTSHVSKEQYLLTQCGESQKSVEEVESMVQSEIGLKDGYTRKHFTVPVQRSVAMSTVQMAFLDALRVQDRVSYVDPWAVAPCWQKAIGCGAALDSNATVKAEQLDGAEVVFMDCGSDCTSVHERSNGVHVPASQDANPLATAEYIKFIAAFFNKEKEAEQLYKATKTGYEEASVGASARPKVAWVSYSAPSQWSAEEFVISQATYKLHMTTAAGGEPLSTAALEAALGNVSGVIVKDAVAALPSAGKTIAFPVSAFSSAAEASQQLWAVLGDVDVIVDETYAPTPKSYDFAKFLSNYGLTTSSSLKFVNNNMVMRIDGTISASNGLDWYESRMANPHWAVEGFARVIHSDASKRSKYFRNIAKDEVPQVFDSSMCPVALPVCEPTKYPVVIDRLYGTTTTTVTTTAAGVQDISGAGVTSPGLFAMLFTLGFLVPAVL